nr:hypothetical protein [Tanacetum cinerariifolium]
RTGDKAPNTSGNAGTDVIGDLHLLRDGPAKVLGDGGVSRVSLSVVSSSDDKNGEIAGSSGGAISDVVSGMVVGIVPNKITRPAGVPMLSSDESDEIEITKVAITCTSKVHINHLYIKHA